MTASLDSKITGSDVRKALSHIFELGVGTVYGEMSLDTIRAFIKTKPFRLNPSITSIFQRLRINHD